MYKVNVSVGENVSLPCILQDGPKHQEDDAELQRCNFQTTWKKIEDSNERPLITYSEREGMNHLWPNVTLEIEVDRARPRGSHLQLKEVQPSDGGFYICEIKCSSNATRTVTKLNVEEKATTLESTLFDKANTTDYMTLVRAEAYGSNEWMNKLRYGKLCIAIIGIVLSCLSCVCVGNI